MADINYILKDESTNDNQLIKDLSLIIKNHGNNKKSKIDSTFINKIIDTILQYYEINYNKLELIQVKDIYGAWDCDEGILNLNRDGIFEEAKEYKRYLNLGNDRIYLYYGLINTIIHELTHAVQYQLSETENNYIYKSSYNLLLNNYEDYIENYDTILIERYADLRGSIIAYKALSYIYPEDKTKGIKELVFSSMFKGYKIDNNGKITNSNEICIIDRNSNIIPPIDTYNSIMENNLLPKVNINQDNMDLYTRFYLGLNISTLEYQWLNLLYNKVYNNIESKEDIKVLINKFKPQKN